jgi:hypothetical protein
MDFDQTWPEAVIQRTDKNNTKGQSEDVIQRTDKNNTKGQSEAVIQRTDKAMAKQIIFVRPLNYIF